MIPYMVGKLAPNSLHLTSGLVKYVPAKSYFRVVPSQNGDKYVTYPLPPQSFFCKLSTNRMERVACAKSERTVVNNLQVGKNLPISTFFNGVGERG